jgi:hypothetical protein
MYKLLAKDVPDLLRRCDAAIYKLSREKLTAWNGILNSQA